MTRVAVLGTGKMGAAMARRLASLGHELTLWNRTRSRAEQVGVGRVASTPAEAARDAEVVISILTDADAVRAAYLGDSGAVEAAQHQLFIDMSTAGPDVPYTVAAPIERAGAGFVNAPVLGTVTAIEAGKATVLAGGADDEVEHARGILEAFGEVRRAGDFRTAAALKLVANSMLIGVTALAAELQQAATRAGVDPDDAFFVISRVAPLLANRKAGLVEHRYEPVTFALKDAAKDMRLASELFAGTGSRAPMTAAARELYERVAPALGDKEMSAVAAAFDEPATR